MIGGLSRQTAGQNDGTAARDARCPVNPRSASLQNTGSPIFGEPVSLASGCAYRLSRLGRWGGWLCGRLGGSVGFFLNLALALLAVERIVGGVDPADDNCRADQLRAAEGLA